MTGVPGRDPRHRFLVVLVLFSTVWAGSLDGGTESEEQHYELESASADESDHRIKGELLALDKPEIIGTHVITPQNADGSGGLYGVDYTIKAVIGDCENPGRCPMAIDDVSFSVDHACSVEINVYDGVLELAEFDDGTWRIEWGDWEGPGTYKDEGSTHDCW